VGLYDRDYMRERKTPARTGFKTSGGKPSKNNNLLIIVAVVSFILGFILGKII